MIYSNRSQQNSICGVDCYSWSTDTTANQRLYS